MYLKFKEDRILAVVAHPDDAELLCAGTLARAKADGAAIGVCVLCRGDKGQPDPPIENLADVRSREMKTAAALLGAELLEGGFGDGELLDTVESRKAVTELVRQFRPTLVVAHSASDYHTDHRAASVLAEAATWFCASAGQSTPTVRMEASPILWWMDTVEMIGFNPHFYVDITAHLEVKRQMIRCHKTQVARAGATEFAPLEDLMMRQCETRGRQCGVRAAEAFRQHNAWKRIGAW